MTDPKRPDPWIEIVSRHHRWMRPFIAIEWTMEWAVFLLSRLALFDLLKLLANLSLLVGAISYVLSAPVRQQAAADQRKAKQYQALQVIQLARGSGVGAGRREALYDLYKDGVTLDGVDLSKAHLALIALPFVQLNYSNLDGADLMGSCLRSASFSNSTMEFILLIGADLQNAMFMHAHLRGARLDHSILRRTNLFYSDLRGAYLPKSIFDAGQMDGANVYGAQIPHETEEELERFYKWAIEERGAVCIPSDDEWNRYHLDSQNIGFIKKKSNIMTCKSGQPQPLGTPWIAIRGPCEK
jgi:hypothetical protein